VNNRRHASSVTRMTTSAADRLAPTLQGIEMEIKKWQEDWESDQSKYFDVEGCMQREIDELRADILRLESCITWEQNRDGRIGTHGDDCYKWGSQHYECLLRKFDEINAAKTSQVSIDTKEFRRVALRYGASLIKDIPLSEDDTLAELIAHIDVHCAQQVAVSVSNVEDERGAYTQAIFDALQKSRSAMREVHERQNFGKSNCDQPDIPLVTIDSEGTKIKPGLIFLQVTRSN
jgi:hypothetical protein